MRSYHQLTTSKRTVPDTIIRHTHPQIDYCGMERTNEERDELYPSAGASFSSQSIDQSDKAVAIILVGWTHRTRKYNITLPRAWISMHGPRVLTGYNSLEMGMTIVYTVHAEHV